MSDLEFEWDVAKAEANLRKHGLSFQAATRVFDDAFALVEHDLSVDYGEDRYVATGLANGVVIVVVYTEREERIRLISARKANGREQRAYHQG